MCGNLKAKREQRSLFYCVSGINNNTTHKKQMEEQWVIDLRNFVCDEPDPSEIMGMSYIHFTKEQRSWGGIVAGRENYEKKRGLWAQTEEQWERVRSKGGKAAGKKLYDTGKGLFGMSDEDKCKSYIKGGTIQGNINKELKKGICGLSKEERSKNTTKQNEQRWKCLVTGHISTYNALSRFQNNRGIDKTMRDLV